MIYLKDEVFSRHFTLYSLTRTDQDANNTPTNAAYENLKWKLAPVLEEIYTKIGPFSVISAYRSPTVNSLVGGSPTSHHMSGLAADLDPLTMSPDEFWARIWEDRSIRSKLSELALKPTNVHLSVKEWSSQQTKPLIQEYGSYRKLTGSEISEIIKGELAATGGPGAMVYASAGVATLFAVGLLAYQWKSRRK